MKKRTFKKLVTGMAIGLLFSTTLVYGNTDDFSFTLNPTQVAYTNIRMKEVGGDALIRQYSADSVIEYTILTATNFAKTDPTPITGAGSKTLHYTTATLVGNSLKLKLYNDPADNAGGIRNASGFWIP